MDAAGNWECYRNQVAVGLFLPNKPEKKLAVALPTSAALNTPKATATPAKQTGWMLQTESAH